MGLHEPSASVAVLTHVNARIAAIPTRREHPDEDRRHSRQSSSCATSAGPPSPLTGRCSRWRIYGVPLRLFVMKWGAYLCRPSSRCGPVRRSIVCNALSRSSTTSRGSGTITPCAAGVEWEHCSAQSVCEAACETVADFGRCRRHVLLRAFARRASRDRHHHWRGKRRLSRRIARGHDHRHIARAAGRCRDERHGCARDVSVQHAPTGRLRDGGVAAWLCQIR